MLQLHSMSFASGLIKVSNNIDTYAIDPFKKKKSLFAMYYDSTSYVYRGILRSPIKSTFITEIEKDWSFIYISEISESTILKIPYISTVENYLNERMLFQRENNLLKMINDTLIVDQESSRILQDNRGSGIEFIGIDAGRLGRVSLTARGNVTLKGNLVFQDTELVRSKLNETRNTHLEFDQTQRISVEGKVGDRVSVNVDHDSERDFNWENNLRINYKGEEDDIIQSLDAGNVSLSLPGSQSLMGSASHQGLFGVKTVSKLGPMDITAIASIVNTEKKSQEYKGRSESQSFKIKDHNFVRNKYFFIHEWFRDGTSSIVDGRQVFIPSFYPLVDGLHRIGNIVVRNFELYQLDQSTNSETNPGTAYADLDNPQESYDQTGNFKRLEQGQDYILSEDLGYIRLRQKANDEVLGCTYVLVDRESGDTLSVIGQTVSEINDYLEMKMIKPRNLVPSHPVWPLMFKNVYYLGTNNINKEGFELRIINDRLSVPSHLDSKGTPYITYFGLDSLNESGVRTFDQKVDLTNSNVISLVDGELFFPAFHPFAADSLPDGNQTQGLKGSLGEGKMYFSSQQTQINNDSRFTIEVDYANQSGTINLGFMIVEGSEQVYKGGIPLKRGIDYQIDYFSGTVVLSDDVDPNADIKVTFDNHQIVTFDKKTILGIRSQMDFGENSFIGGTALYYNQSVVNEKVEVGYEPMRNFIWGLNGRMQREIPFLTRAFDRLPIIETDKASRISFEGEFAQILPNPNPINNSATGDRNGVAFIDDFEGSKRTTTIPILRRFWKESSAPIDLYSRKSLNQRKRANLRWFNPFMQVRTKDIWPNLSTSIQAQNETTDIMVLQYDKKDYQMNMSNDSLWSGIITPFYSGDYDQTQTKFFEIWIKGDEGTLSIDLGQISEDRDGNGVLNTEDIPVGGLIGDGILDDEEDIGIDGCSDSYENGWGGCLSKEGLSYAEYKELGEVELINTSNDVEEDDPNGDNWEYNEGSSDYSKINGTEGNALDAGRYPDTEDLDRTGFLDRTNDYFTRSFSLADTVFLAGQTKKDGDFTGWRLYRIPLNEFVPISNLQNREWNNIHHLRLRLSDIADQASVQIAKIELVGNEWQELGLAKGSFENFTKESSDSTFAISVINTDDNASYQPPKGVKGEYDQINQIRSKEQSLVLKFNQLPPRTSGAAIKSMIALSGDRAQSYLSYDKMKMYVHGSGINIGNENSDVEMFMRFGFGDNYYELRQPVYSGWDEGKNRNSVDLDLKWLTALKLKDSTSVRKFRETDIFADSINFREYRFTDELGIETGKKITIKGNPALNRIQFFVVGVINISDQPIDGEVWLDELRLSGVNKERGISMRMQSRLNISDIANTSFAYRRQDADFHVLQSRLGSNRSTESLNLNSGVNLEKFLPSEWGIKLPVTTSFANSISRPKYFPGQDIIVNENNTPDSILSLSTNMNLSIAFSKPSKSDNNLLKYTLDKINTRFSINRQMMSNEIQKEVLAESYQGQMSYALPFGRDNYIKPFKRLAFIPYLGAKIKDTQIYYLPSAFNASVNFNERLGQRTPRKGDKSPDDYNFGLSQSYILDYKLTDKINTKYTRSVNSNMNEYRGYIANNLFKGDIGFVSDRNENFSSSFSPKLTEWLNPNFNFSSNYRWSKSQDKNIEGSNIGNQVRFTTGTSFNLSRMIESYYTPKQVPPQRAPSERTRSRSRSRRAPTSEPNTTNINSQENTNDEAKDSFILRYVHAISKRINPINFSYTENLNKTGVGVLGDVPFSYRIGLKKYHGLDHSEQVGTNTGNFDHKKDFSIRSGISLSRSISFSFNYAQNLSTNIRGSGLQQRSMTRDYLSYGKFLENGFPFVGWSVRMTGLERNRIIGKYIKTMSIDHALNGKENRAWQFDKFNGPALSFLGIEDFISKYGDNERTSRVNMNFSPLIGATLSLNKGVTMTIRHNRTNSRETTSNGGQKIFNDQSYLITANYSHRGGFEIPLPFFDNYKINNQVNFTFNFDMNKNQTLQKSLEANKFAETAFTSSWKSGMRLTYSFSESVSGSMIWEYRESDSMHTGKRVDRDFGFDVNLAIRG